MGYHEASAISNAPAKDQKCHKLTFSIHSLFIQRVSIPFLSGLSSNMLVMIQMVYGRRSGCDCNGFLIGFKPTIARIAVGCPNL